MIVLLLSVLAFADPPPCEWPDGRPGLCYDRPLLEARALTRADLTRCEARRETDTQRAVLAAQAAVDARTAEAAALAKVDSMKRRRWQAVALGAAAGVAVSAGVVWTGVQVTRQK